MALAAVYLHHGSFRRRHLLAEARRHLTRELIGRRARPGLDDRIVAAAIRAHCVDVTPPPTPGRRPRPPGHTAYTVSWHPALSGAHSPSGSAGGEVPELTVHARAMATSIRLQAMLRAGRGEVRPVPARKPGGVQQAAAAAAYEQLAIDDVQEQQDPGPELSPEHLARLEELVRQSRDRAAAVPKAKKRKRKPGPDFRLRGLKYGPRRP